MIAFNNINLIILILILKMVFSFNLGIVSNDKSCIYYLGIIDTLTNYDAKKKMEHFIKAAAYGPTISAVPP